MPECKPACLNSSVIQIQRSCASYESRCRTHRIEVRPLGLWLTERLLSAFMASWQSPARSWLSAWTASGQSTRRLVIACDSPAAARGSAVQAVRLTARTGRVNRSPIAIGARSRRFNDRVRDGYFDLHLEAEKACAASGLGGVERLVRAQQQARSRSTFVRNAGRDAAGQRHPGRYR